jgi:DNA adenine methylase
VTKLGPLLEEIHERLSGIVIECLSWDTFIARYDDPCTLLYLDPPYWNSEDDYGTGRFVKTDFAGLAIVLSKIRGRFILSVNDVPETREFFGRFRLEPVSTRYTIADGEWAEAKELIIMGPLRDDAAFSPTPDLLRL